MAFYQYTKDKVRVGYNDIGYGGMGVEFSATINGGEAERFANLLTAFYGDSFEVACKRAFGCDFDYDRFVSFCERNGFRYESYTFIS